MCSFRGKCFSSVSNDAWNAKLYHVTCVRIFPLSSMSGKVKKCFTPWIPLTCYTLLISMSYMYITKTLKVSIMYLKYMCVSVHMCNTMTTMQFCNIQGLYINCIKRHLLIEFNLKCLFSTEYWIQLDSLRHNAINKIYMFVYNCIE